SPSPTCTARAARKSRRSTTLRPSPPEGPPHVAADTESPSSSVKCNRRATSIAQTASHAAGADRLQSDQRPLSLVWRGRPCTCRSVAQIALERRAGLLLQSLLPP